MKKLLLAMVLTGGVVAFFSTQHSRPIVSPIQTAANVSVTPSPRPHTGKSSTSLFVPYWTLSSITDWSDYDTLIYFGVTPASRGIDTNETGYQQLETFVTQAAAKRTYLTLRMLDSKQNFAILEDTVRQEQVITETIALAEQYGFDGIVLDLEVSALPFSSLLEQITAFHKRFYTAAKKKDLHYAVTMYGDTFYRIRPFDVKAIGNVSDEVMIMAYDLYKSRGDPGPNFPLQGKEKYGYDYPSLISQFSSAVAPEKLTVIFGLFGYDWRVDSQNNAIENGEPLSYRKISSSFLSACSAPTCRENRDALSAETSLTYTDANGDKHIVWYEDGVSVAKKKEFLQTKGIGSYSYWANSYF